MSANRDPFLPCGSSLLREHPSREDETDEKSQAARFGSAGRGDVRIMNTAAGDKAYRLAYKFAVELDGIPLDCRLRGKNDAVRVDRDTPAACRNGANNILDVVLSLHRIGEAQQTSEC